MKNQETFLLLMQNVLNEIKSLPDDYKAVQLNNCLSQLTEAYKSYLEYLH